MQFQLFETAGIAAYPRRSEWDAEAVDLLGAMLSRWELVPGKVFTAGFSATVLAVTQADGSPAVLKIGYPHAEATAEAVALESWPTGVAPRILRQDPWAWAMLLERIEPGTALLEAGLPPIESLRCGAELLARISGIGPVAGVPVLAEVVHGYAEVARSRSTAQHPELDELGVVDLVRAAIDELDELANGSAPTAMVHGDFNPGNILRSNDSWVAIDPKPMIGDPCYDLWPLVSQIGSPFSRSNAESALAGQLAIAADVSGCDPIRAARWSFARCGLNVSWYLEEGNRRLAASDAAELRVWASLRHKLFPRQGN